MRFAVEKTPESWTGCLPTGWALSGTRPHEGETSEVHLALDEGGRRAACKFLRLGQSQRDLLRESTALQAIAHRDVPAFLAEGELEGRLFLMTDWAEGELLAEQLRLEGRLRVARTLRILRALCEPLRALHEAGFIHRDLCADNVIVRPDDRVSLLDLGHVVRRGGDEPPRSGIAHRHCPPESWFGTTDRPETDIYGLASLAYEMLVGAPPFPGSGAGRLELQLRGACHVAAVLEGSVAPRVAALVEQSLAPEAEDRPLLDDWSAVLDQELDT